MKKTTLSKKIALCSLATVIGLAGQVAFAHTGIKDKVFIEGQGNTGISGVDNTTGKITYSATAYTGFTATHGCATNAIAEGTVGATRLNVIAQAALFPNSASSADAIVYRYKSGTVSSATPGVDGSVLTGQATTLPVASPNDLSGDIVGALAGAAFNNLGLGLVSPNLFGNWVIPKLDSGKTFARGYAVYNGQTITPALQEDVISTTGISAFKFNVPKFQPTSCAKNLIIRVAVTNWCKRGGGKAHDAARKDVWIGTDTGSKLYSMTGADHGIMPNSREILGMTESSITEQGNGKSFWPAMTIVRDLTNNPLPAACNGESYDVVIEPSGTDIDANLTIPSAKFPQGASGAVFE